MELIVQPTGEGNGIALPSCRGKGVHSFFFRAGLSFLPVPSN